MTLRPNYFLSSLGILWVRFSTVKGQQPHCREVVDFKNTRTRTYHFLPLPLSLGKLIARSRPADPRAHCYAINQRHNTPPETKARTQFRQPSAIDSSAAKQAGGLPRADAPLPEKDADIVQHAVANQIETDQCTFPYRIKSRCFLSPNVCRDAPCRLLVPQQSQSNIQQAKYQGCSWQPE